MSDGLSVVEIVASEPKTKKILFSNKEEFVFNSLIIEQGKIQFFGQVGVASDYLNSVQNNVENRNGAIALRIGFDDHTMGSAFVQKRGEPLFFGGGITQMTLIGLLRSSFGASQSEVGNGLGARIEYSSMQNVLPMNTQVNLFSESYSSKFIGSDTLSQVSLKNRYLGSLSMLPLGVDSLRLKMYCDIQNPVTQNTVTLYGATFDLPLSSTSRLIADTAVDKSNHYSLNVVYSIFHANTWTIDCKIQANENTTYIGFGFMANLSPDLGLRTKFDSSDRAVNISYKDAQGETSIVGSYVGNDSSGFVGVDASTSHWGQVYSGSLGVQMDPFGQSKRYALGYSGTRAMVNYIYSDLIDSSLQKTRLSGVSYGTALLFADGVFAMSNPVQGSFALIRATPALGNTPIVANGKIRSDGLGPLVIPRLLEGAENSVFIDAPDAEINLDLGKQSFSILPMYKNGYLINFGSTGTLIVRGILYDKSGKLFIQRKLRISAIQSESEFPDKVLLTSREGELVITGLPIGNYDLFSGSSKTPIIRLQLSQITSDVIDLGEIRLQDGVVTIKK